MLKIEFDKVGIEREFNINDVKYGNAIFMMLSDYTTNIKHENQDIFEFETKPVKLKNFRNVIRRFYLYAKYSPNFHSSGHDDYSVNSAHTHISFKSENDYYNYRSIIENTDYQEKLLMVLSLAGLWNERKFREALTYRTRPIVLKSISFMDKDNWISRNAPSNSNTFEFRINEAVIPLWIYLLPTIDEISYKYSFSAKMLLDKYENKIINEDKSSYLFFELIEELQGICEEWLNSDNAEEVKNITKYYWSNKITSKEMFNNIIDLMFEYKLDMYKVFKKIDKEYNIINRGNIKKLYENYGKYLNLSYNKAKKVKEWHEDLDIIKNKTTSEYVIDYIELGY